jgi:hypothetical protein
VLVNLVFFVKTFPESGIMTEEYPHCVRISCDLIEASQYEQDREWKVCIC